MKYQVMLVVAIVLTALGFGAGCTKKSSSTTNNANSLPSTIYQTPTVNGILTSNGTTIMNISNLTAAGATGNTSVLSPALLTLDLTKSSSNAPSATIAAVVGSTNCVVNNTAPLVYAISCLNPVLAAISVTLTDSTGLVSAITFNVPVTCNPQTVPPIKFASGAITVTPASSAGYVNISVVPPTGGSVGTTFSYSIDINGDGRPDDYKQQFWNSSPTWTNVYDLYNGPRTVTVTAIDNKCQLEQVYSQTVNYQGILPAIQTGATAVAESYYYIQGQVDPLSGASSAAKTDLADTVHPFDAMDDGGAGAHVRCTYNYGRSGGANLTINGFNTYSDGNTNSGVESALQQNMSLAMTVPNDTGGLGTVTQSPAPVTSLAYQTSMAPELMSGNQFTTTSGCTGAVTITKTPSSGTCATMPSNQVLLITMLGTYSCPNLSNAVSVTNGYFYCQYDTANNCGGGGGGGGNPPPSF